MKVRIESKAKTTPRGGTKPTQRQVERSVGRDEPVQTRTRRAAAKNKPNMGEEIPVVPGQAIDYSLNIRSKPPMYSYPKRPLISSVQRGAPTPTPTLITRDRTDMTISGAMSPFGCCNFFDPCTNDVFALHYSPAYGGIPTLLDWFNFTVGTECVKTFEYITYAGGAGLSTAGADPSSALSDPCADPLGIEWGICKNTIEGFGRYGNKGPVREIVRPERYCVSSPQVRLDGQPVTSEYEFDLRMIMDTVYGDLLRDVIVGSGTGGEMVGLQGQVKTGYDCEMLDSKVVEWNGNGMNGGAGTTVNDVGIADTWGIIDILLDFVRYARTRISWSPLLKNQQMRLGDMILVMPNHLISCILDAYTCWSVCAGRQYNETNLNTYEARQFRDRLEGGLFGFGQITLGGLAIPLLAQDHGLLNADGTGDIYFLTGGVGNQRLWQGEFLSAGSAASTYPALFAGSGFRQLDGGRVLVKTSTDNLCIETKAWTFVRTFTKAPHLNMVIQNAACGNVFGPLSADPYLASLYPNGGSFGAATC